MRSKKIIKSLFFLILLVGLSKKTYSQIYLVPCNSNTTIPCTTTPFTLRDCGGTSNYPNNASGYAVIQGGGTRVISITGTYDTEASFDFIRIYNGVGIGGTLLFTSSGIGNINFTSSPGQTITVRFTSDNTQTSTGFNFNFSFTGSCSSLPPPVGNPCNSITVISCGGGINNFTLPAGNGVWNNTWYPGNEKVYSFTPTFSGTYTFNISHSSSGYIDLWALLSCTTSPWISNSGYVYNGSPGSFNQNLTSGTTYYFYIDDGDVSQSNGTFEILCPAAPIDPCTSVTPLSCGTGINFTFLGGYGVVGYPLPFQNKTFSYTPVASGIYTLNVNYITGYNYVSLYKNQNCSPSGWGTPTYINSMSSVSETIALTMGTTKYFLIQDGDDQQSNVSIQLDCPVANPCSSIGTLSCESTSNFTLAQGPGAYSEQLGNEKVYTYTPLFTGQHTITLNNLTGGQAISLYKSSACGSSGWILVGNTNNLTTFNVNLTNGVTAYFLIDDNDINLSEGSIKIECPVNDPCLSITPVVCDVVNSFTLLSGAGYSGFPQPGNEKVYSYIPALTGQYTINLTNNSSGQISLYSSSTCSSSGWTQVSNTITLSSGLTYYFLVDDNDLVSSNGTFKLSCPNQDACTNTIYGDSKASSAADQEIFNVSFGSLNNTSNCTLTAQGSGSVLKQYSNFTGAVTAPTLAAGGQYPFSVTLGECGQSSCSDGGISVYIDYNANGSFLDPNEKVWEKTGCASSAVGIIQSTLISIPINAPIGYKRMRVIFNCDGLTAPTASYLQGETEDYCIEVYPNGTSIATQNLHVLNVKVYPNPTSSQFNVQLEKNNNYKIEILNALGQVLFSKDAEISNSIDLINFDNGLYFLKVLDKNFTLYTTRIIKQ